MRKCMTGIELWNLFAKENNIDKNNCEVWAFGVEADVLANLVVTGEKTATASAYPLYEVEDEPLPSAGESLANAMDNNAFKSGKALLLT